MGTIPIIIVLLLNQNRYLKKVVNSAAILDKTIHSEKFISLQEKQDYNDNVELSSENGKDRISIKEILLIKSVDNYIEVFWDNQNKVKKIMLRNSLKRINNELLLYSSMFYCHRKYIINLLKIKKVSGNSQGYSVQIDGIDESIPVARSNSKIFHDRIVSNQLLI